MTDFEKTRRTNRSVKRLVLPVLPFQSRRMAEMVTWIVFHAHPTQFLEEEDFHPDFFGTFVCPLSRSEPEQLLKEILGNRKLRLIDIRTIQKKSIADDWGMNERLKSQLEEGYGMSLIKTILAPGEMD